MKLLTLAFLLLAGPVAAQSPSLTIPLLPGSVDLASVVKALHPCYIYDQHKSGLAGAYTHVYNLHDASGTSFVDLNGGLAWKTQDGVGGPLLSIGLRVDNLSQRALGTSWARAHVSGITLPAWEVGPFGAYINRLGWLYGAFAALSF